MLGLAGESALGQVRRAVAPHRPDDLEDLERLITLGRLELEASDGDGAP